MNEITLFEDNNKKRKNNGLGAALSDIMKNESLLPILMLAFLYKSGQITHDTQDIARSAEIMRMAKPYFKESHKDAISKTENILDAMYALNRLSKGEYKKDENYRSSYFDTKDKPIQMLKAVKPHMKGKSRETVEKVLIVDDRIKKLKSPSSEKRNVVKDFEHMTDILEILKHDKGSEARDMINKVKQIMDIMRK